MNMLDALMSARSSLLAPVALGAALTFVGTAPAAADYDSAIRDYEANRHAAAIAEFQRLAQRGHGAAEFMIGVMYFSGRGVEKHVGDAATWFHKAAMQGYPPAQLAYGSLHLRGVGLTPDPVAAYMWLALAANSGVPGLALQAATLRDDAAKALKPAELERARRLARDWRPRCANLGGPWEGGARDSFGPCGSGAG
jgi:TPR repeat protein